MTLGGDDPLRALARKHGLAAGADEEEEETPLEKLAREAAERAAAPPDPVEVDSTQLNTLNRASTPAITPLAAARIARARGAVEDAEPENAGLTALRSLGMGVSRVGKQALRGIAQIDDDLGEAIGQPGSKLASTLDRAAAAIGRNEAGLTPSQESIGANPWAAAGGESIGEFAATSVPYHAGAIGARPLTRSIGRLASRARAGELGAVAEKTIGKLGADQTIGPLTRGRTVLEKGKAAARALPGELATDVPITMALYPGEDPLSPENAGFSVLAALMEGAGTPRTGRAPPRAPAPAVTSIRKKLASVIHPEGKAELEKAHDERRLAERALEVDDLTGAANKASFRKALPKAEADPATSVVRFDVNGFKSVNDVHGHDAGDKALIGVPAELVRAAKELGIPERVFRVGGDEFAALVPTDKAEAFRDLAEQIYGVKDHGENVKTSISGGIGRTDAAADAQAISRKQAHKAKQGIVDPRAAGGAKLVEPAEPPSPLQELADRTGIRASSRVVSMPTKDIEVDAERMQFKLDTDEKGVGRGLSTVEKYNPELAGALALWKDPANGKTYVVNGHHRLALAKRTGTENVEAYFIDAPDAATARARGALANIAEGHGTALDAAKFFRDSKVGPEDLKAEGVELSGRIAKAGLSLSKLEPDVFAKVATGKVSEAHGAIIGNALELPEMQRAAANLVENSPKKLTEAQVAELVNQVRAAGSEQVKQDSLFGEESTGTSLVYDRADVAAEVKRRLSADKKLFGYVSKGSRGEELARGGNVIDVESSGQIARSSAVLEEVFNTEAHSAGEVGRSITEAARRVANGESVRKVVDDIYDSLREAVDRAVPRGAAGDGAPPPGAARGGESPPREGAAEEVTVPPDPDQEALFAPGSRDLFGERTPDIEPAQTSLLGGTEGTAAARNLRQTETAARAELARLKQRIPLESDPKKKVAAARRIAELEKLVNRDKAISLDELETRIIAEKETIAELGVQGGLFSPAPAKGAAAEAKLLEGTKVVDEKGEPLTVFHGTGVAFDKWARPGKSNVYGPGHYFAEDPRHASFYATGDGGFGGKSSSPNVRQVKLDIKKPYMVEEPIPKAETDRLIAIAKEMYPKIWKAKADGGLLRGENGGEIYTGLSMSLGNDFGRVNRVLQKAGYDGIKYEMSVDPHEFGLADEYPDVVPYDDAVWVAFKSSQIRTAGENIPITSETLFSPATAPGSSLRRRVAKIMGDGTPDPEDVKALITITRELAKATNPAVRQGRASLGKRKALGVFFTKSESIRVRRLDDVSTVAHEIGHYISKKHLGNPTRKAGSTAKLPIPAKAKDELLQMGHDLYGSRKPAGGYGEEGIAQYFSFYVTDPARMLQEAPAFHSFMESTVYPKEPALRDALDQAQTDFADYKAAPSAARVDAMISVNEKVRNVPTWRGIMMAVFDDLNEFKVAVDELGGERDPLKNAYTLARLSRGDAGAAEEMIQRGVIDFNTRGRLTRGVEEILSEIPPKRLQAFRRYLVAEKALEKGAQGIDSGIKLEDAAALKKELEAEFAKPAEEVWDISQKLIDYRKEAGLLTEEQADLIKEKNQRRVGFYRVFDENEANTKGSGSGRGFGRNSSGIQKMTGSARRIIDPLESLVTDIYKTVHQAHTHNVMQQLVGLARRTEGGARVAEVLTERPRHAVTIPVEKVINQLLELGFEIPKDMPEEKILRLATGVLEDFQYNVTAGPREAKDMVVPYIKDGERFWVQLKDRRLYDSVAGLDRQQLPQWARILTSPTRTLRAGATLTLEFMGRNPAKDAWTAAIFSKAGFHPPGYDFARGMFSFLRQDEFYQQWRLEGGDNAAMLGLDRAGIQRSLKSFLRSGPEKLVDVVLHPIDTLRLVSSATENATRLGEFRSVLEQELKKGTPKAQAQKTAAFAARDVTIDFARAGVQGRMINEIVAFFNANIQGNAKMVTEIRTRPTVILPRIAASITIPSIALYLAQRDDPAYQEIPRWQKDLFWIWVDRDDAGNVDHIWRLPKPPGLGVLFGSVPERIVEWAVERDPKALDNIIKGIMATAVPGILPTGVAPLIENWANKSWFRDRPIVPRSTDKLDPGLRAGRYASETARQLGQIFDYPPAMIDNLIRGWTGGLGSDYAVKASDAAIRGTRKLMGKEPLSPQSSRESLLENKLPGIRGFSIREPGSDAESVEYVYRRFGQAEERRQTWKSMLNQGKTAEARAYFKEHRDEIISVVTKADAGREGELRSAHNAIGKLQDIAYDLQQAKLPAAERKEKLRKVHDAMIRIAQNSDPAHRKRVGSPAPDPVDVELEKIGANVKDADTVKSVVAAAIASAEYQAIDELAGQLVAKEPRYAGRSRSALAKELKKDHIEGAVAAYRRQQ